jgi:hypothetical protein
MEHISEARLTLVCPKLADKIRTLADMLAQEGIANPGSSGTSLMD